MTFAAELLEKRRAAICRFMCVADTCKAWPKCYTVLAKIEAADAAAGAITESNSDRIAVRIAARNAALEEAAKACMKVARQNNKGAKINMETQTDLRKAGKNIRSGENAAVFNKHGQLAGIYMDRAAGAKDCAAVIRALVKP